MTGALCLRVRAGPRLEFVFIISAVPNDLCYTVDLLKRQFKPLALVMVGYCQRARLKVQVYRVLSSVECLIIVECLGVFNCDGCYFTINPVPCTCKVFID